MKPKIKIRYSPMLAKQEADKVVIGEGDTVITQPAKYGRSEVKGKVKFIEDGYASIIEVVSYKPYRTRTVIKHVDGLILFSPSAKRVYPGSYKSDTIMTFGKHKGLPISALPAAYCIYFLDHCKPFGDMKVWLEANKDVFDKELNNKA